MAYITIDTDDRGGFTALHERLSGDDLDNDSFCERLVERLRWAVEDTEPTRDLLDDAPPPVTLAGGILDALDPRATRS